ncbi:MAG: response regulator [Chloroflexi bacterium]|nr:response regulator [Chloroflexota bacterium]
MTQPKVLVVEDDEHLVDGIKDILQENGYEVWTAINGEQGLEVLRQQPYPPDLILSDIMMPRMNGYEFLRAVREQIEWVGIPFIFLTALSELDDIIQARRMGVEDFITKPFDPNELAVTIDVKLTQFRRGNEARKKKVAEIKSGILTILNHEFRTPLTYVVAYAGMLRCDPGTLSKSDLNSFLRGINAGAKRLRRLIENFIMLVEIETGEATKKFEQQQETLSHYRSLVEKIQKKYRDLADEKQVVLEVQVENNLPPMRTYPQYLNAALECLVDNAIKFSDKPNTHVVLSVTGDRNQICFTVKDQGRGFPDYETDNIFDTFYQINRKKFEDQGAGSGLAIVDGVVRLHKGRVTAQSVLGQSSTFSMFLPTHMGDSQPEGTRQWSAQNLRRKPKILIVEDDLHLIEGMKEILSIHDYDVMTATDGMQALTLLENMPVAPDLIVSDIMMPHMNGYDFLRKLRQDSKWDTVPFIFLTAKAEPEDRKMARRMGIEDFVVKPFDTRLLLSTIFGTLKRWEELGTVWRKEVEGIKYDILKILHHEFNTPLMYMIGYADMLTSDPENLSAEDLQQFLKGVDNGANRLRRLVENFILLVELETGEAKENFKIRQNFFDEYAALLRSVQVKYQSLADEKMQTLQIDVAGPLPPIKADLEYLAAAVECLVDNAIKFSERPDGVIRIRAFSDSDQVGISVEDQGRGIPEQELKNIFGILYQVKREVYEDQGAGSGLAIVDGVSRLHGGSIGVQSVFGQGSTFTLLLPVSRLDDDPF